MTASAEAPFLEHVRLLPPDEITDETVGGGDGTTTGDDGLDPDEFPAWYRDKVVDGGDESAGSTVDGGTVAGSTADGADGDTAGGPDAYVDDLPAVRDLDDLEFGAVTVLAGDNGSGKSTLIEAIAVAAGFNAEGGSRNLVFSTFDTHSALHDRLVLRWNRRPRWGWFLRAETFYGMASHITVDDDPFGGLKHIFPDLHGQSHGETFLALAESRFTGAGLYFFDEPESALSIQGQMRLLAIVQRSLRAGSQFVIATHSPVFQSIPGAKVWQVDREDGLERTTFEDLTSTVLWRRFLADPATFHERFAGPDEPPTE